jgi:hypothetical protein
MCIGAVVVCPGGGGGGTLPMGGCCEGVRCVFGGGGGAERIDCEAGGDERKDALAAPFSPGPDGWLVCD